MTTLAIFALTFAVICAGFSIKQGLFAIADAIKGNV